MRYAVEVFVGPDSIRNYLVDATDEATARDKACEYVRDLVGAEITLADGSAEDESDYDGVVEVSLEVPERHALAAHYRKIHGHESTDDLVGIHAADHASGRWQHDPTDWFLFIDEEHLA